MTTAHLINATDARVQLEERIYTARHLSVVGRIALESKDDGVSADLRCASVATVLGMVADLLMKAEEGAELLAQDARQAIQPDYQANKGIS